MNIFLALIQRKICHTHIYVWAVCNESLPLKRPCGSHCLYSKYFLVLYFSEWEREREREPWLIMLMNDDDPKRWSHQKNHSQFLITIILWTTTACSARVASNQPPALIPDTCRSCVGLDSFSSFLLCGWFVCVAHNESFEL